MVKPLVAIVGRPNVGKSTLYNRIAGGRSAIVSDVAGTTRDRLMTDVEWGGTGFVLIDTGGLELEPTRSTQVAGLSDEVRIQVEVAIADADVIVLVVDTVEGITPDDEDVAQSLRMAGKPLVLAANKADNPERENASVEFHALGIGDPIPVSAYHNRGVDDLMAAVVEVLPESDPGYESMADLSLAIVGRANAGKSQLLNAIAGEARSIVSDVPGTTRDAIDSLIERDGTSILLIDTAGIRRRGSVERGIERYSVLRSLRAIERAQVALLLLDVTELATAQDAHIASYVLDDYRGIVVAINKWDLAPSLGLNKAGAEKYVRERLKFLRFAPVRFISALKGDGVGELLDAASEVHTQWMRSLPRYDLRRTILNAVADHPPASNPRHGLKVYGVTQDSVGPPGFTIYVNRSDYVHFSYRRYLENSIRETYGFEGTPFKMRFKGRGDLEQ
jgi:GTP-binding protein